MPLCVIQGGPEPEPPPFYVSQVHEDDGLPGFQVCWRTGHVGRVQENGVVRTEVLDQCVGWCVNDKAVAEAFVAAMNERYAQDFKDDPL